MLRAYLASYHVGRFLAIAHLTNHYTYSGYSDFSDVDLMRLQAALLDIKKTADEHGARVYVILVPSPNDFQRARQGSNRLGPVLVHWAAAHDIAALDLLPEMVARTPGDYSPIFLPCDNHWSPYGAGLTAEILQPWMYGK